jgi:hypothetical protein
MVALFDGMIYEFNVVYMARLKKRSHELKGIIELACIFDGLFLICDVMGMAMH